jgi:hypothetical protein
MKDLFLDWLPAVDISDNKLIISKGGNYWHVRVTDEQFAKLKIENNQYVEITTKTEFNKLSSRYKTVEGLPLHVYDCLSFNDDKE